jgi:hypothetical protein
MPLSTALPHTADAHTLANAVLNALKEKGLLVKLDDSE